ncbi:amino acid adenylation domain-containing protein [Rhodococcus sp. Eu-32]|uniref:non-ribosomal peptide synthetase n=1 Tax=Rhodococcus sp. Eu-32 TaxID=1017319 RepID=UPI000DF3EC92|nr:non-ribosomal peptide synthetase [Rhodococcus sp. Eu-32]RRQ29133.1 amino acid adenylation domain-containing protein [Rhodococcus sp. Eu-32]
MASKSTRVAARSPAPSAFPLSPAQADIYLAQTVDPHVPFTIAQYVDVVGGIDVPTLTRASYITTRELESPIVSLCERDGVVYQQVDRHATYGLEYRDLTGEADPVETALAYMESRCRQPVDMLHDRLMISELLQVGPRRWFWFSRVHHVVMDGLGAIALRERTAAVYAAMIDGAEIPPTRGLSLRAIRDHELAYETSTRFESDRTYWEAVLANRPERVWLAGRSAPVGGAAISVGATLKDTAAVGVPDVLAAFALYLARLTDTDDVVLSLPVSGRTTARLRASIGMLANVVPLRVAVPSTTTVGELRRRVELALSGALRHQRYDAGHSFGPTVNIMTFGNEIRLGDTVGDYHVLSSGPVDDIMVNVYPGLPGASTRVDLLGNPLLYDVVALTTHRDRFLSVLDAFVAADDGVAVSAIALPPADLGCVPAPVPPCTLPELLRGRAGDVALRYGETSYTYDRLRGEIDRLAEQLVAAGARPEVRVAVAMARSHRSVVACWAVARAGASFVPVDPADPRSVDMMRAADVRLGLTDVQPVCDDIRWIAPGADAAPVVASVSVDNEAYVVHTSGTTGIPKGVSVTHRGLAALADAVVEQYRVDRTSRVLHLASPVFDASIQEMLMAFAAGATLVVAPTDVTSGRRLADLIAAERITHLITAPAVLATLAPEDLDGVAVFDVGGDVCPPALRDRFAPGHTMLDAYGPTEATVVATVSAPMRVDEPVAIGRPIPGVRAVVLDRALRPVAAGGVGELYLGGDGIARGYDRRFGSTAATFVADPFTPGQRLYRTGDRVRTSAAGDVLEFLGRTDTQVQVNGRRIELGEIEACLVRHRSVRDAVVVVRGTSLVAFVVVDDDDDHVANLDAHVRSSLPHWMVPSTITVVDEIPLAPSGKPDRGALSNPDDDAQYEAPMSPTEIAVAEVFSTALGIDRVGRHHNLLDAGGDSLTASTVLARLGTSVTLAELFRHPTVASLAALLDERHAVPMTPLASVVVPDRVPLSAAQFRIWMAEQTNESTVYALPVAVRLPDGQAQNAIAALRDVLGRHDILRTYFPADEDGAHQVVVDASQVLIDLPELEAASIEAGLNLCAATPFDLTAEVPLRATVLRTPDGDALAIVAHHIAVDGRSVEVVLRDFARAFQARGVGRPPEWVPLAVQYAHFASSNHAHVDVAPLDDAPTAYLPADGTRGSLRISRRPVDIAVNDVRMLAQNARVTPFMVVHSIFVTTLARFSGLGRTVIGTPTSGRTHPDTVDMVGMFALTVPLVVQVDREATFVELLDQVGRSDLAALSDIRHAAPRIMLSYENQVDLPSDVVTGTKNVSEFDLGLVLTESENNIDGWLEYASDMYRRETVDAFLAAFQRTLGAVAADPAVVVGDIEWVVGATAPSHARAGEGTLLDVFRSVDLDGTVAVAADVLERRSNRLARSLIAHGAGPETTVAISLERSADYIVAMWAVVKSGAAFMPVDPQYPAARRAQMLRGTSLGIGGSESDVTWVSEADAGACRDAAVTDADRRGPLRPDNVAYVVHTSGSTGTPKRVTVTHRAVHALARQAVPRYRVTSKSRVLQGYSLNFDAAVLEILLAFGSGATLVVAPPTLAGGVETAEYLRAHGVTHFLSTPALLATVPPVDTITTVAVGGDVLPDSVVGQWSTGRTMLNAYGPTESTVVATLTEPLTTTATIGAPLDSVHALVLDARLHPVPLGAIGELYLGGDGVARGYGEAASTAASFVAGAGGRRLYRTGDLVRRRPDGALDFVGRADAQVQLRGVRVELGDVEAALTSHPALTRAVADVRDERLVAWVVGDAAVDARAWASSRLPASMVPAMIEFVDDIPVTANGKVDRAALMAPDVVATQQGSPRTLRESIVLGILSDVLGVDDLTVDADFFAHGGDSLTALRAVGRIGSTFAVEVSLRTLFDAPTARTLAAVLDTSSGRRVALPVLRHSPDGGTDLSAAERRIWLHNRLDSASSAYNLAFALALPRDVDTRALRRAIVDVIDRHEPLRTVYAPGPVVSVRAADDVVPDLALRVDDIDRIANAGFDLTVDAPVRVALVDSGREHVDLVVVAHHIAVDGASVAPLVRDVRVALDARFDGRSPEFPYLAVDYADYRRWHREILDIVAPTQLAFWEQALQGLPDYLELPSGTPTADGPATPANFTIDDATAVELRALARRLGATTFVVVHAAVALLLADLASTDDVAVGTPVSGRTDPLLDDLVGMFVGTVVLRTPIDRALTFEQFVADVRGRDLDAFAHADVPFDDVVEHLAPPRRGDAHPFFQVLLSVSSQPVVDDLTVRPLPTGDTQFDLEIVLDDASMTGSIAFAPGRFDMDTVRMVASRLTALLRAVVREPTTELRRIDVLGTYGQLPAHTVGVSESCTFADVFDHAVTRWPDATAVVDGTDHLTYRELGARATELSYALLQRGAAPGTVVALALPRSIDHFVAVWAVARTGAAFLPVDPAHPASRIADIVSEAAPVAGVSNEPICDGTHWLPPESTASPSAAVRPTPDDPAYVIYTSGSTGTPKGVRVTGRGIANLVATQRETFGVDDRSAVLQFASPGFDASVFEILLAAGSGASLVVAPPAVHAGRELADFMTTAGVTHVCLTPAVLAATDPGAAPTVTTVITAGDVAGSELVRRWAPGRSVFDAYGPTEATIMGTCSDDLAAGVDSGIGWPTRGFDALVLDPVLRQVPTGVVGELYLAGPALADGYVARPGLTASRFVPDLLGKPGARMYRTGDVVRWRLGSGGPYLEFLGRADTQVKIRGHRVEPAEVEAALLQHPAVDQAFVTGRHSDTGTVLDAYVTGDGTHTDLRTFLARMLPSYLVPSTVTTVDALPTTLAGKIDVSRLPAPVLASSSTRRPSTELETIVCTAFADVLGIHPDNVDVDADFFDLGGHSLGAVQVSDSLSGLLGREVPVAWMFVDRTVSAMADRLERSSNMLAQNMFDVLLPLTPGRDGIPVFCIHPAVGIAWSYAALAAHVDAPIYGLQRPGVAGDEIAPTSIDDYADRYADEIRAVRPHGPYVVLGWSLGGVIAHAVGTRLQKGGAEVTLVLVDAHLTEPENAPQFTARDLGRHLGAEGHSFEAISRNLAATYPGAATVTSEHLRRMYEPVVAAPALVAANAPEKFSGDTIYLSARNSDGASQWHPFVDRPVRVRGLDVEHDEMLGPVGASVIGEELRAVLSPQAAEGPGVGGDVHS